MKTVVYTNQEFILHLAALQHYVDFLKLYSEIPNEWAHLTETEIHDVLNSTKTLLNRLNKIA